MAELKPPTERQCLRCGRRDVWDEKSGNWAIKSEGEAGKPFCIHEWDINGTYNPIEE